MPHRNAALADRLAELGLNQEELAEALNEAIDVATGQPGRTTGRYVRLLVSGSIGWPRAAQRNALEAVLGQSVHDLGFAPRGRSTHARSRVRPRVGAWISHEGASVDRRELLGITGGMVGVLTLPGVPLAGRLGSSDLERLRRPLREMVTLDDRHGSGARLGQVAAAQARRILRLVETCETSDRVQRELYSLAGEYLASASWFSIDAGAEEAAGPYLDEALRVAAAARDPVLSAQVWNCMIMRARQLGDRAEEYAVARAGVESGAARKNPRMAALFHARLAQAHAWRAERGRAVRSLGRAADSLARARDDTPTPTWLRFFDEAELAALAATTHNILGDFTAGEALARTAISRLSPTYVRNLALHTLTLAESRLGGREVEHAASTAVVALRLSAGVRSSRVERRLTGLRESFSRWPEVPAANEWAEGHGHTRRRAAR